MTKNLRKTVRLSAQVASSLKERPTESLIGACIMTGCCVAAVLFSAMPGRAATPNTFGYAVQGASIGTTMSNSVSATPYQMAGQNGTVTSKSVFVASAVSASPNNQFHVATYSDNNGTPGALIASRVSATIVPDAWNTGPISAPVAANTYDWLVYNTNDLAANTTNLRYDDGGATSKWISLEPFGAWPATFGPIGGTTSYRASIYANLLSMTTTSLPSQQ